MENKSIRKKAYIDKTYCVGCGICEKTCPLKAITIYKGIYSQIDFDKCVGCSKCTKVCPASTIELK